MEGQYTVATQFPDHHININSNNTVGAVVVARKVEGHTGRVGNLMEDQMAVIQPITEVLVENMGGPCKCREERCLEFPLVCHIK